MSVLLQSMFVAEWTPEQHWKGQMMPYGPLHLDPAAQAGFPSLHLLFIKSPEPAHARKTSMLVTSWGFCRAASGFCLFSTDVLMMLLLCSGNVFKPTLQPVPTPSSYSCEAGMTKQISGPILELSVPFLQQLA